MKIKLTYILLFIITLITINSCERDDICIDEITPKLVITFYDKEDPSSVKIVTNLSAKIIIGTESDSIPILVNDTIISIPTNRIDTKFAFFVSI